MAQTKAKSKKGSAPKRAASSKSKSKTKPRSQSKPKAAKKAAKPKSPSSKRSSSNGSRSSNGNGSSGGTSPLEAVRSAVGGAGKAAGKAKVPLVAGGAAIAGAAGGLALAASKQGSKKGLKAAMPRPPKIKIDSGDVAKAAKQVGNFSAQVGELANELQRARESADGKHRSPVEVVLQGLTARR